MDRDASNTESQPNDHSTYNEEENMDRAAQSGSEGAFGADNPDSSLEQMRSDAEAAFGEAEDDQTADPSPS